LRVFGSVYYKHIPDQLRKKLNDKRVPLILDGYHSTIGYKLFDLEIGHVIVSIDMVVDERRT